MTDDTQVGHRLVRKIVGMLQIQSVPRSAAAASPASPGGGLERRPAPSLLEDLPADAPHQLNQRVALIEQVLKSLAEAIVLVRVAVCLRTHGHRQKLQEKCLNINRTGNSLPPSARDCSKASKCYPFCKTTYFSNDIRRRATATCCREAK